MLSRLFKVAFAVLLILTLSSEALTCVGKNRIESVGKPKKPEKIVIANPRVDKNPVKRGEIVTLDGSKSKSIPPGKIEYKWTFKATPGAQGDAPNNDATITDMIADVTFLNNTAVTLTVTDGKKSDSKTINVKVIARRDFKTPYSTVEEEGRLYDSTYKPRYYESAVLKQSDFRRADNVCAIDDNFDKSLSHCLHPDPDPRTGVDADEMFELKKVNDKGPWNGFFYLHSWKMELTRKIMISNYIHEESPPPFSNLDHSFYYYNVSEDKRSIVKKFIAAVREHEQVHSILMERGLNDGKGDPAKICEAMFGKEDNSLKEEALKEIREAEERISKATKDPLKQNFSGNLFLAPANTGGKWEVFLIEVGDRSSIKWK
ncbi:MAG: hypothetical protein FWF87_01375 [Synergistaceae bacterium]|nr:hypothetical protein [Synergistaceae bacterium]